MKNLLRCCFVLFFLCHFLLPINFSKANETPVEVTVIHLLETANDYDGKDIMISGEVVGQALYRKNGGWFHLMDDDENVIGIWADLEILQSISFWGRYGIQGDHLTIIGTFFHTWPEHGGDTGIKLQRIVAKETGYLHPPETLQKNKLIALLLLFLLSLIIIAGKLIQARQIKLNS